MLNAAAADRGAHRSIGGMGGPLGGGLAPSPVNSGSMGAKSGASGAVALVGRGTSTVAHVCQSAVRCSGTAVRGLAFGQGISLLVAGTGVFSQYLARRHVRYHAWPRAVLRCLPRVLRCLATSAYVRALTLVLALCNPCLAQVYVPTTQSFLNYVLLALHLLYLLWVRRGPWRLKVRAGDAGSWRDDRFRANAQRLTDARLQLWWRVAGALVEVRAAGAV